MTVYWFKGKGLGKKEGVVFLRVFDGGKEAVNPMHTLNLSKEGEGEKNRKECKRKSTCNYY